MVIGIQWVVVETFGVDIKYYMALNPLFVPSKVEVNEVWIWRHMIHWSTNSLRKVVQKSKSSWI